MKAASLAFTWKILICSAKINHVLRCSLSGQLACGPLFEVLHRSCSWLNRKSSALPSVGFVRRLESPSWKVRLGLQFYSICLYNNLIRKNNIVKRKTLFWPYLVMICHFQETASQENVEVPNIEIAENLKHLLTMKNMLWKLRRIDLRSWFRSELHKLFWRGMFSGSRHVYPSLTIVFASSPSCQPSLLLHSKVIVTSCNGNPVGVRVQREDRKIQGRQMMCLDRGSNPGLRN